MKELLNFKNHLSACREIIRLLTRHRQLTYEMAKRDISDRYLGQVFGMLWTIGHPLVLIGVYVFIFVVVFKIKVGGTAALPFDFTTYLLAGLIPWLCFQETMTKASNAIIANANLVKQVVFPIEILPVKGVLAALVTMTIFLCFFVLYVFARHLYLPLTYLLLPLLMVMQALAMTGVAFILSAVSTYFRDLKDFVQIFCVIGLYLLPIVYLPAQVPALFRPVLYANPFSYLIWCYQDALYFGRFEHPWAWGILLALSMASFIGGYRIFRRLKNFFGNVL